MIDIMLGLDWMDKCQTLDNLLWRNAVEDLVRETAALVSMTHKSHHICFAERVNQELRRCKASVLPWI